MSEPDRTWKETDRLFDLPTRAESALRSVSRFGYLLRLQFLTFLFLELAFVSLTWFCFDQPLPLPYIDYSYLSTAKSGFVAIFNVWHTIAVACGFYTCYESFSREWAARSERTDMVSTVCSGMLDRITYSFKSRATRTFKAALLVFLALMLLRTTGSSSITVTGATGMGFIHVSDLIAPPVMESYPTFFTGKLNQANLITRLEQLHGVDTGFKPEPNWLIPLPVLNAESGALTVTYNTDLVHFNYSCHWQAPDDIVLGYGTVIGNETWKDWFVDYSDYSGVVNTSTVVQLTPASNSTGVSVFLFMGGGNSTLYTDATTTPPQTENDTISDEWLQPGTDMIQYQWSDVDQWEIDLSNQPTVDLREMTNQTTVPPLATLLICDPHLYFTSGVVRLSPTPDLNTPDIRVISESPNTRIGNIDPSTAQDLFSWALSKASGPISDNLETDTDSMGVALFLSPMSKSNDTILQLAPRDYRIIEKKLGVYMLSALKAFTGGFTGNASVEADGMNTRNYTTVRADYDNDGLALETSLPFAMGYSVLFVFTACGLVGLGYVNSTQCRVLFDLESIEEEVEKRILLRGSWEKGNL